MLDGRSTCFNNLKEILSPMKRIIPAALESISNLSSFAKHEIGNCSKESVSSIFVSHNKSISISFVIIKVAISNMFVIKLMFNRPIIIWFGFSSLRFRKVS